MKFLKVFRRVFLQNTFERLSLEVASGNIVINSCSKKVFNCSCQDEYVALLFLYQEEDVTLLSRTFVMSK